MQTSDSNPVSVDGVDDPSLLFFNEQHNHRLHKYYLDLIFKSTNLSLMSYLRSELLFLNSLLGSSTWIFPIGTSNITCQPNLLFPIKSHQFLFSVTTVKRITIFSIAQPHTFSTSWTSMRLISKVKTMKRSRVKKLI